MSSICALQSNILARLLSTRTLEKMSRNEAENGAKAYTAANMFADLHKTIWNNPARSDYYRRNMQKAYVTNLIALIDNPDSSDAKSMSGSARPRSYSDVPAIARGELLAINRIVKSAAASTSGITQSHYQNLSALIDSALKTK